MFTLFRLRRVVCDPVARSDSEQAEDLTEYPLVA